MTAALKFDLVTGRLSTVSAPSAESLQLLTSMPYPVQLNESMGLGVALDSGRLYQGVQNLPVESITLGASLGAGSLREPLQAASMGAENMTLGAALAAGELRQLQRSQDIPAEIVKLGATLDSGSLAVKLVSYTGWPSENATLGATLSSGSLV